MFGGDKPPDNPFLGVPGAGSPFTLPANWGTTGKKTPTTDTEKEVGRPSVQSDATSAESRQVFRPSIFGQAIGDMMRGVPRSSTPSSTPSSVPSVNSEILTLQSLFVADVPDELMDKNIMMKHFSQFGQVTKIHLAVKRKSCTLSFDSHESAERAKLHGTSIGNVVLQMFWAKPASLRTSEGRRSLNSKSLSSSTSSTGSKIRDSQLLDSSKHGNKRLARRTIGGSDSKKYVVPDDVKDELSSMLHQDPFSFSERNSSTVQSQERIGKRLISKQVAVLSKPKKDRGSREHSPSTTVSTRVLTTSSADTEMVYNSNVSIDELQKVMRTPANTAEERFRVLEARDKLLRMKRVRQSDLSKAHINRGTCPDLCPEKERYHREFQRQVAPYEHVGVPGKIDHKKAVKQYSRSSADQEEPLSHELRPAHVLRLTMDYMMWQLMDVCYKPDENLADWYHYIWDRTRGIRKDVTQQELCDENAVALVEQCARWHIFCSERLIAEDLMVYDDNINTENLTKCLQTLKYMYQDLSFKGVSCPNEAEFRAYFVLLNLNEGDCMWEVQQLSSEIRESAPVRFALQVSAALSSNNYIRFFKLVRASTYLNACILHRYFAQVRSQALHTIHKAFCTGLKETVFTLEEFIHLAGLENVNEAATLCLHHGLRLTEDKRSVVFTRSSFFQPDSALSTTRVLSLVEAKRMFSVGEIVSGGAEPDVAYEAHVPHDSFDDRGMLKPRAWTALDQDRSAVVGDDEPEANYLREEQAAEDDARRKAAVRQQEIELRVVKMYKEVLEQVVSDELCTVVAETMKLALTDAAAIDFSQEIISLVTREIISEVCGEVFKQEVTTEQNRVRALQLATEAEMLQKMREKRFLQELNSYLDAFMLETAQEVIDDEFAREAYRKKLTERVIEEFVQEECRQIAVELVAEYRAVEIEAIFARAQKRQLKLIFDRWRSAAAKSKLRKESIADFPAWMSNMTLDEQVSVLEQPDRFLIQNMNPFRFAANKLKLFALEHEKPSLASFDVATAVMHHLSARMKELSLRDAYVFWKMLVSIPDSEEAPRNSDIVKQWTETVFTLDDKSPLSLEQVKPSSYETVTVCVRSSVGDDVSADACRGTDGLLFWVSHRGASLASARRRLLAVLEAKPSVPAVPVALILTGPMSINNKQICRELDLVELRASKLVSYFKVFPRKSNTGDGLICQMKDACLWLAELAPERPPMTVTSMRSLMNRYVVDELWCRVTASVSVQVPNSMIELYNSSLVKLKDVLCDEMLDRFSLGATEFSKYVDDNTLNQEQRRYQVAPGYWGSNDYFTRVNEVLSAARIPLFESWPPETDCDLKDIIVSYCRNLGVPHIVSKLYLIIQQHSRFQTRRSFPPTSIDWQSFLKTIPWSTVIQTIVEAKLDLLDYTYNSTRSSSREELVVVVHRDTFDQLINSLWWLAEYSSDDLIDSEAEKVAEEEKASQKRSFIEDSPMPSKQQKLSFVETLSSIKAAINKIDSTFNAVKTTWAEIDADPLNNSM